jgi:hypothetical protein
MSVQVQSPENRGNGSYYTIDQFVEIAQHNSVFEGVIASTWSDVTWTGDGDPQRLRGFLQPLLVRSLGAIPGILAAALPFGLLHFQEYGNSWRHALLISLAGAAFGWMRHRTGSTMASTLMHASYNALEFFAFFTQQKDSAHP